MDLTLLLLRDFVSENCHAKFGGNWTTHKGETEGGTGQDRVNVTYIHFCLILYHKGPIKLIQRVEITYLVSSIM